MKIEDYTKKEAEGRSHDSKERRGLYSYWPKKGKDCLKFQNLAERQESTPFGPTAIRCQYIQIWASL